MKLQKSTPYLFSQCVIYLSYEHFYDSAEHSIGVTRLLALGIHCPPTSVLFCCHPTHGCSINRSIPLIPPWIEADTSREWAEFFFILYFYARLYNRATVEGISDEFASLYNSNSKDEDKKTQDYGRRLGTQVLYFLLLFFFLDVCLWLFTSSIWIGAAASGSGWISACFPFSLAF